MNQSKSNSTRRNHPLFQMKENVPPRTAILARPWQPGRIARPDAKAIRSRCFASGINTAQANLAERISIYPIVVGPEMSCFLQRFVFHNSQR